MKVVLKMSNDGSHTLYREDLEETYHSVHGAIQEANHVFIEAGLSLFENTKSEVRILEVGWGTGLNGILTYQFAQEQEMQIDYVGYEKFPISEEIMDQLNYPHLLACDKVFKEMHACPWNESIVFSENFVFCKKDVDIFSLQDQAKYDLIYFDAFGPNAQAEMWSIALFEKLYNALQPNGVLVTYCAKGQVRRDLQAVGFTMERLPGPPGKREMLRGKKRA